MPQPRISRLDIWQAHEDRVLRVLSEALILLRRKAGDLETEVQLNRELWFCLFEANHNLYQAGEGGFDQPPACEPKNAPDPDDETRAQREDKMPDFHWGFIDHAEPNPRRQGRFYYVECKRLGRPTTRRWRLNENYVCHGILRFLTIEHGYAKGERSAAMVGYIQNMAFEPILAEVNAAATARSITPLPAPIEHWQQNGVTRIDQLLARPFRISPIALRHLWVDFRGCYSHGPC